MADTVEDQLSLCNTSLTSKIADYNEAYDKMIKNWLDFFLCQQTKVRLNICLKVYSDNLTQCKNATKACGYTFMATAPMIAPQGLFYTESETFADCGNCGHVEVTGKPLTKQQYIQLFAAPPTAAIPPNLTFIPGPVLTKQQLQTLLQDNTLPPGVIQFLLKSTPGKIPFSSTWDAIFKGNASDAAKLQACNDILNGKYNIIPITQKIKGKTINGLIPVNLTMDDLIKKVEANTTVITTNLNTCQTQSSVVIKKMCDTKKALDECCKKLSELIDDPKADPKCKKQQRCQVIDEKKTGCVDGTPPECKTD